MRWLLALGLAACISWPARAARDAEPLAMYNPHGATADMMALFNDDAPWPEARKKIKVMILVHYWVRLTPLDQVRQVVEFTKRHHMTINLSVEPLRRYPTEACGNNVEGYTDAGELGEAARILKSLDADVSQVEMDEPLWFGSLSTWSGDCQLSLQDTINRATLNLQEILAYYPNVKLTDIEPIPAVTNVPTWKDDLQTMEIGLTRALGRPINLVQVDINWPDPAWQQALVSLQTYLRQRNMGLGIIYNASPLTLSDKDWLNNAIANVETIEGRLHIIPDVASFQTWSNFPACNLPETSPTTLTWWINRYLRPRSFLAAQFVGQGARGKLTTSDGKPIANAIISGFKPGVDFLKPLPTLVTQGVVPANAVSAIIGVRINTECWGCNGTNDVLVGPIQYQEIAGGAAKLTYSIPSRPRTENGVIFDSETVGGAAVTRVIAMPGQSILYNSSIFSVTPNAKYVFAIPAATVGGLGWNGNVILIWLDANGNGTRLMFVPDPGKALTSQTVTAADGTFLLPKLPRSVDGPNPVSIEFDGGNGAYRSTVWYPLH